MDPQAALLSAETAIIDDEQEDAAEALHAYRDWRDSGGFEPTVTPQHLGDKHPVRGDKFYYRLSAMFVLTYEELVECYPA